MHFIYGKNDWRTMERGQENCYLLTNGLGGYSSLTMIGSLTRNDHALLMACTKAPVTRYHMVSRLEEILSFGEENVTLSSQQFVNYTQDREGYRYQNVFRMNITPEWLYQAGGFRVKKELVMEYGKNTVAVRYRILNREKHSGVFTLFPQLQFVRKGSYLSEAQDFVTTQDRIESNGLTLYYATNGKVTQLPKSYQGDYLFLYDARDGRPSVGAAVQTHSIRFDLPAGEETECLVLYSMEARPETEELSERVSELFDAEKARMEGLMAQAEFQEETARILTMSADRYLADRESTGGKTIMAGFPFFEDWGRDTMIAMVGICISTRRFGEARNIFRTFIKYLHNGVMPNMFPEDGKEPLYNTVDASLLFITAVAEYFRASGDETFIKEAWPAMKDIIAWYEKGTDFHIRMDEDGLIQAGAELEQVTWMDVRIGEFLPTPRHGKPVEVNAYWYHALKTMESFGRLLGEDGEAERLGALSQKVKESFREKFWNEEEGCLYDTRSGEGEPSKTDRQVRCNQIWAVSIPDGLLTKEQEKQVVDKVYAQLYTPWGLRSLSYKDEQFHSVYGGSQVNRDMAYHQGTVWGFPLGGYYMAYLKVNGYSEEAKNEVRVCLEGLYPCLREGCIGHIAEIYDGLTPALSQGCFAQAWSVGEILRVYDAIR